MLKEVVRFADDTAGLEKALRLFQSFCTIAVGLVTSAEDLAFWVKLRAQFALGRRYFRILKWYPCFSNGLNVLGQGRPLRTAIESCKWLFLGLYFFLEMFTISNAMGATTYEWGPKVQMEANRCWFFGLVFSILLSLYDLFLREPTPTTQNGSTDAAADEKTNGHTKAKPEKSPAVDKKSNTAKSEATKTWWQLGIDSCDLFIPGAAVGWIPVSPLLVGIASTISTTIAGTQIWNRVQQKAKQA